MVCVNYKVAGVLKPTARSLQVSAFADTFRDDELLSYPTTTSILSSRIRTSTSSRDLTIASAIVSSSAGYVVCNAITRIPAAWADRIPAGVSSKTRQSAGATPSKAAPFRYGSGEGLPLTTSSAVINRFGIGTPTCCNRATAKDGVAEVTIVKRSSGSLDNNPTAPGTAMMPSLSSISICSTLRFSWSASSSGATTRRVSALRRPCAC